jgi:hypothetical protein
MKEASNQPMIRTDWAMNARGEIMVAPPSLSDISVVS